MPRTEPRSGFTLIELLVVIGILSLLVAAFYPAITDALLTANKAADSAQLLRHNQWLRAYAQKNGHYPFASGHKFVLATWVDGEVEHTRANVDFFFNPALRKANAHYDELRRADPDSIWRDLDGVTSADTDYAGRSMTPPSDLDSGREAWMADDNENGWAFRDGSIHVLYGDGRVTALTAADLKERFGWDRIDPERPFPSCGPESPCPDLRKLAR